MQETIQGMLSGFEAFPPMVRYILLGSVLVAVFVMIFRLSKKGKKLKEALSDKKYRRNSSGMGLVSDRQAALNVGAINGEQTMFYVDSLKTGGDKFSLKEALSDYYGIEDTPGSAEQTLIRLFQYGHRIYFDAIKNDFSPNGANAPIDDLEEEVNLDPERLKEFKSNLKECTKDLIRYGFIKSEAELAETQIVAWDMGRVVNVTRCCYECGYIGEERAWEIILAAYEESKKAYADWKEFAAGYIIGRAMWGGSNSSLDGLMAITLELLEDEDSPWRQTALK